MTDWRPELRGAGTELLRSNSSARVASEAQRRAVRASSPSLPPDEDLGTMKRMRCTVRSLMAAPWQTRSGDCGWRNASRGSLVRRTNRRDAARSVARPHRGLGPASSDAFWEACILS